MLLNRVRRNSSNSPHPSHSAKPSQHPSSQGISRPFSQTVSYAITMHPQDMLTLPIPHVPIYSTRRTNQPLIMRTQITRHAKCQKPRHRSSCNLQATNPFEKETLHPQPTNNAFPFFRFRQTNAAVPTTENTCKISQGYRVRTCVSMKSTSPNAMAGKRPVVMYSSISASFLYHSLRSHSSNSFWSWRGMSAIANRRQ